MPKVILAAVLIGTIAFARADGLLGRPYTWDPQGLVPLDAERPMRPNEKKWLDLLREGEVERAASQVRHSLLKDDKGFLAAWVVVQAARVRKNARTVVEDLLALQRKRASSPAIHYALFKLHSLLMAQFKGRKMRLYGSRGGNPQTEYGLLSEKMEHWRDQCRPWSSSHLPIAIAISQAYPLWQREPRALLEEYRKAHPKGPDIRPYLCRAYVIGVEGYAVDDKGRKRPNQPNVRLPGAPEPDRAIELANEVLKDKPSASAAHYYLGRAYFKKGDTQKALEHMRKFLKAPEPPAPLVGSAKSFLERQWPGAFYSPPIE